MTLFDLEPYGGSAPTAKERRAVRTPTPPPLVEPLEGGYHYLRNRYGVMPFAHLIASISPNSAAVTICGRIGTKMSDVGVSTMVRCQECDLAQQIQ